MRNLLDGDNVRLAAIREDDMDTIENWFNNVEFLRYYDMLPAIPKSRGEVEKMIKDYQDSQERFIFAIREKKTGKIIGIAGFDEIISSNGTATVFIGIGDESFKGKGLGRETMLLLIDYGFNEMNFHRIQLNVISYNEVAIKMYEKLGFAREGTYREFISRDGKRYDMYLYGMLRSEWEARYRG
ncbi:MAG: GNAT family N-acetyltransferase [Clostridiaceae bacterium]|nr:GNAT family N-acetyltransferase [Clostridiaceae bacterium]